MDFRLNMSHQMENRIILITKNCMKFNFQIDSSYNPYIVPNEKKKNLQISN